MEGSDAQLGSNTRRASQSGKIGELRQPTPGRMIESLNAPTSLTMTDVGTDPGFVVALR